MINTIDSVLKKIDLFQQPVPIYVKKKRSFGTVFGGIISFAFLSFMVLVIYYSISSVFGQSSVTTSSYIKINEFKNPIQLNPNNFMFGIVVLLNNGSGQSIMNLNNSFYNFQVQKLECNLGTCSTINVSLVPCQELNLASIWTPILFDGILCPSNFSLELLGSNVGLDFTNSYQTLQLIVTPCQNPQSNVTCASPSEIQGGFQTYLSEVYIYYTNQIIDPSQLNSESQGYVDYISVPIFPQNFTVNYNLFADLVQIQTTQGRVFPQTTTTPDFYFENQGQTTYSPFIPNSNSSPSLMFSIKRSPYTRYFKTDQTNIYGVFIALGGFGVFLYVIFNFLISRYSRTLSEIELSNNLFKFPSKPDPREEKRQIESAKEMSLMSSVMLDSEIARKDPNKESRKKVGEYFYKNLYPSQEALKKLDMRFGEYFTHSAASCMITHIKTKEERLLEEAKTRVQEDLDVIEISKKLREFERLKKIVLNEDQLRFFNILSQEKIELNYLPEPIIPPEIEVKTENRTFYNIVKEGNSLLEEKIKPNSLENFWGLYQTYISFLKDLNGNLNKQLLDQMDKTLVMTFEQIKDHIGEEPTREKFEKYLGECIKLYKPKVL